MPRPTTPQAAQFFADAQTTMSYLASRWADERGYEHIASYAAPLRPIAEKYGVRIERMISRPFGCEFSVDSPPRKFVCTLTIGGKYMYKRVA